MSDEKMKIPEDLKVWYSVACDGVHFQTDYAVIKTLIERIARTEAQLSASQEQVRRLTEALKKADKCVALGTYPLAVETHREIRAALSQKEPTGSK